MFISHLLIKQIIIKQLKGLKDWVEWDRKLQDILGLAGLWKVLTRKSAKLINKNTEKLAI